MISIMLAATLGAATPLWQMSQTELDAYLARQGEATASFAQRLSAIAQDSVGMPYFNGPLGEGPGAKYDPDPLMDHTRVDCVTFCEQSIAMAASKSYREAYDLLQTIRYRGGKIDFEARNHFMIADWMPNNPWCRDVTRTLGIETPALTRTENHRDFFKRANAPELGEGFSDQAITIRYIPVALARPVEKQLPAPALILFIGKKPDWLFTLHTGLYLSDEQGQGALYHASSKEGKVVAMSLADYVESQQDRFLGFMAYSIEEPGSKPKSANISKKREQEEK